MQPTPLRGLKIGAILKARFAQVPSRSIAAARLMGIPLAGFSLLPSLLHLNLVAIAILRGL